MVKSLRTRQLEEVIYISCTLVIHTGKLDHFVQVVGSLCQHKTKEKKLHYQALKIQIEEVSFRTNPSWFS